MTEDSGEPHRIHTDIDQNAKISLRRAGRMPSWRRRHPQAGQRVTILIDANSVTVIQRGTGEAHSEHTIDPDRSYWRNQHKTTRAMATAI